ncbi:NAD-dependent epimerase/dehydratase family protein [Altericista sp. CCNU0014]|uniref:NAD-dependent epimerase/dehydratase family protein n=1 Tax=Altericista sp. CCNU0014 TaxID=3082949 RepID=UPI00384A6075
MVAAIEDDIYATPNRFEGRASSMHFIVTGGAGFIGSHLTEYLLAAGHAVTAVDDLSSGSRRNLPLHDRLQLISKNVLECRPVDFSEPVDGIVHLAASPSVVRSWADPLPAHDNNLTATLASLQLTQMLKIPRFVYASSAAVYGNPSQSPIAEDRPTIPISPYGLQKLASEHYIRMFAEQYGFSAVVLRLFNVFGPRQLPTSPYSGVISIFAAAMNGGLPITIFGDGCQTRDFMYVKEVAIALTSALMTQMPARAHVICNIGTGTSISLLESIDLLRPHFPNWQNEIVFAPARTGDIRHSCPCIAKAAEVLGFVPQGSVRSSLETFIQSLKT